MYSTIILSMKFVFINGIGNGYAIESVFKGALAVKIIFTIWITYSTPEERIIGICLILDIPIFYCMEDIGILLCTWLSEF